MKLFIGMDPVVVEPGVGPSAPRGRAAADGGAECMIDSSRVWTIAQRLAQTVRALEFRRVQHHARIRRPPQYRLVRRIPGEDAAFVRRPQPCGAKVAARGE